MELDRIIQRYASGLEAADATPLPAGRNPRRGVPYLPGVKSLSERQVVSQVAAWWECRYPREVSGTNSQATGVPYAGVPRAACDHVLTTDRGQDPEWAIEVKRVALVGDNGKRSDFAVSKVLSPFLKDRSLLHDASRLRFYPPARRLAVIGFAFDYSATSCDEAERRHPAHADKIEEIRLICEANGGDLNVRDLVTFADGFLRLRNWATGHLHERHFQAWQHPCGGIGRVFGWEIVNPERVRPDPRHPW